MLSCTCFGVYLEKVVYIIKYYKFQTRNEILLYFWQIYFKWNIKNYSNKILSALLLVRLGSWVIIIYFCLIVYIFLAQAYIIFGPKQW